MLMCVCIYIYYSICTQIREFFFLEEKTELDFIKTKKPVTICIYH